jgi:hypothetical protein
MSSKIVDENFQKKIEKSFSAQASWKWIPLYRVT